MLIDQEIVRLSFFLFFLIFFAVMEIIIERKKRKQKRIHRWKINGSLALINTFSHKILFFISPMITAQLALKYQFGLLNQFHIQDFLKGALTFIFLDMLIYWQHRIFHKIPILWRLHLVHHSDKDMDVSTGFRFHFAEMTLSMLIKTLGVLFIGGSPEGVFAAELALSLGALFSHANIDLGSRDLLLQKFVVTPDMHRIHHGLDRRLSDTNFSFSISVWDRIFGTYQGSDSANHDALELGGIFPGKDQPESLISLILAPFKRF